MIPRFLLAIVTLAGGMGCSGPRAVEVPAVEPEREPEPVMEPEPGASEVAMPNEEPSHVVALGGVVALDDEISLRVSSVIVEQIEASPEDPQSYPAGSGVSVTVVLLRGADEQQATLTLLSEGYESQPESVLHGYRIRLLDVEDPDRSPRAALIVERAQ